MRRSIIPRILIPAVFIAAAVVSLVGRLLAAPPQLILAYPTATTVSGCGLVYTTQREYQWPCQIFANGVDPR